MLRFRGVDCIGVAHGRNTAGRRPAPGSRVLTEPLFILAVLGLNVAVSEWLARHTALRHLGSALLVIVLTALAANLGAIPTVSDEVAVYGQIFDHVAPLGIFLLLLQVRLSGLSNVGLPLLGLFLAGSAGTMLGVVGGLWVAGGSATFGATHAALGGMFVGTYTGGSLNFTAVALEYGVVEQGPLFAGAAVVDSAMTTVWMAATVVIPRLLAPSRPKVSSTTGVAGNRAPALDRETVDPFHLALLLAIGALAVWGSGRLSGLIAELAGVRVPEILVLTTLALALAQLPVVQRLRGVRLCGMLAVMVFLAVIGALCDFSALASMGQLGVSLTVLVVVAVSVHGTVVFGLAAIFRQDPILAAVASQANIGGGTSALALARSLNRDDLVLPAILIGSLGNALGTYLGLLTAGLLG